MKLVFSHNNNLLVSNAQNTLENAGIETVLKNEHASTGGHTNFVHLELWIKDDHDETKATELLDAISKDQTAEDWECTACHEKNGAAFEVCWKCQQAVELSA
ncbi:DUF2007 domain-containing protein [Paraglaciecola aquimarina]|uniref:DUF2007 domain-containing protein n=1 Tax=Paraglaciecola algarum TaxID=3050085 RepID=A0ABS9DBN1_9ALTE|nr:DUF2007 domain-containing protein [Paraglaciecola sp. G1-23]MCF2950339.1 DUF2007 domain-containing protein [Paraglaciecola sp. G1-23]